MARHRLDRRKVKRHYSYTINEAAQTIGAARGTIRRWIKNGLPVIDDRKPHLILGDDLARHMDDRKPAKTVCPPGSCYCVKCKGARQPAGNMAEFVPINARSGNMRALCPDCGNLMHRRTSYAQLEAIQAFLDVTIVEPVTRLNDSDAPSSNDHLDKEPLTHA
ncbi:MAG: helix-turn-helix domain-containing protein [Hyphomicrobiaceae bacterium]|nr:helix-turn-helix domain-containing protein [Hyphomicrobiaceae bacterium]